MKTKNRIPLIEVLKDPKKRRAMMEQSVSSNDYSEVNKKRKQYSSSRKHSKIVFAHCG